MDDLEDIVECLEKIRVIMQDVLVAVNRVPRRHYFNDEATATVTSITEKPAHLAFIEVQNPNTTPCWIQWFDHRRQGVALGEEKPQWSLLIPAGDGTTPGWDAHEFSYPGIRFDEAISYACTTTVNGDTAPSLDLTVNAAYVPASGLY